MDIEMYLDELKSLHTNLLYFIDFNENEEENFQKLIKNIEEQNIKADQHELNNFLHLLNEISFNHYRSIDFFAKIEKIMLAIKTEIKKYLQNMQIFKIFKNNIRMLLFLIEEKILNIDQNVFDEIIKFKTTTIVYFAPEILPFLKEKATYQRENEAMKDSYINYSYLYQDIEDKYNKNKVNFKQKRKVGENDNYLCKIIRNDSIEEFITTVNRENYSLNSNIKSSYFETNKLLLKQYNVSLIEYAAFFGAIQIFRYLYKNGVELKPSIIRYAVHGDNEEIINILEECGIELNHADIKNIKLDNDESYEKCYIKSIKCHHNNLADYIKRNYLKKSPSDIMYIMYAFKAHNYSQIENEMINNELLIYACKYNYYKIVQLLIKSKKIDVNAMIISIYILL